MQTQDSALPEGRPADGFVRTPAPEWAPSRESAYPIWVSYAQQAEANSWNRFYNFLTFSSILVLAWSAIYSQSTRPAWAIPVMVSISGLGVLSSLAWSALGYRGREFNTMFLTKAAALEARAPEECRVCQEALAFRKTLPFRFLGSWGILVFSPWLVAALYLVLLAVSLVQH
jgi:hypothetical protein